MHVRVDMKIVGCLAGIEQVSRRKQLEIVSWLHRWLANVQKQSDTLPKAKNS